MDSLQNLEPALQRSGCPVREGRKKKKTTNNKKQNQSDWQTAPQLKLHLHLHPSHPLPPAAEEAAALGGDLSYTGITFVIKESQLHNQEGRTCHDFFFFSLSIVMKS